MGHLPLRQGPHCLGTELASDLVVGAYSLTSFADMCSDAVLNSFQMLAAFLNEGTELSPFIVMLKHLMLAGHHGTHL